MQADRSARHGHGFAHGGCTAVRSSFEMEMQAHMSAGSLCGGSWSWSFMRRAVGTQGALSATNILQYISVILERCANAGTGLF